MPLLSISIQTPKSSELFVMVVMAAAMAVIVVVVVVMMMVMIMMAAAVFVMAFFTEHGMMRLQEFRRLRHAELCGVQHVFETFFPVAAVEKRNPGKIHGLPVPALCGSAPHGNRFFLVFLKAVHALKQKACHNCLRLRIFCLCRLRDEGNAFFRIAG